jgi:hypothetical protein
MNGRINRLEGAGEVRDYIWLRYGTQFTMNGRSHTVEMSVPMPIGADEEMREQLLREADAGMNQLAEHVENRVAQMLQRVQPTQGKIPTPAPIARSSPQPRPASLPAPQTAPQPLQSGPVRTREARAEPVASAAATNARTYEKEYEDFPVANEVVSRQNIGASMPSIPAGDSSGNLSLQQFIGYIRENMGMNPKQAMDLLKIKTLSGINLREALEQLQKIAGQETATTSTEQKIQETVSATRSVGDSSVAANTSLASSSESTNNVAKSLASGRGNSINEASPAYNSFAEEIEPEEDDELEDLEESREFTIHERVQAREKVSSLRELRGATVVNAGRLQALNNVAGSQISQQQIQDLIQGMWSVTSVKKLKVDQAEALISWAKEDDFVNEVEAVLSILEED